MLLSEPILGILERRPLSNDTQPSQWPDGTDSDVHNPYAAPAEVGDIAQLEDSDLATLSARFVGAFVDGLLTIPVYLVVFALALQFGADLPEDGILSDFVAGLAVAIVVTLWHLLLNGYFLATRGQTLGKMVAGTKIVDAKTGEILPLMPLVFKRFVSMHVLSLIPGVGSFIGLIDTLMIFRENRRCFHDDFAGTKVITIRK